MKTKRQRNNNNETQEYEQAPAVADVLARDGPGDHDSQALQLGFELALRERDAAVREQARTSEDLVEARRRLDALQAERDRAISSLDNLSSRLEKPPNP